MDMLLPPVLRDYRRDKMHPKEPDSWATAPWAEEEPAVLDSYARGLWRQWQALEKTIDEAPEENYPKETIRAAFAQLMDAYVEAEAPIPYELSRLARAVANPKPHVSTSPVQAGSEYAYWAAIRFEAKHPASHPASRYEVAQHLLDVGAFRNAGREQKSAESTVRGWRKLSHYQNNVQLYRTEKG